MVWTDDEIYKVVDGMRFSVLYKGRIHDVVDAPYAEGTMIGIRDDLAQQLAMLEFINNANKELNEKLHAENQGLREEVARLKATLDGDPNQTVIPEQRRAWRQSAIRYADKVEAERDELKKQIEQLKSGTYHPLPDGDYRMACGGHISLSGDGVGLEVTDKHGHWALLHMVDYRFCRKEEKRKEPFTLPPPIVS